MRRTGIRRISVRRLEETSRYHYRRKQFLLAHPYCQVWLAENGIPETQAMSVHGLVLIGEKVIAVPLSTEVHHKNKRRGHDLLDQEHWMAVSEDAHKRIEANKAWARARGFLLAF